MRGSRYECMQRPLPPKTSIHSYIWFIERMFLSKLCFCNVWISKRRLGSWFIFDTRRLVSHAIRFQFGLDSFYAISISENVRTWTVGVCKWTYMILSLYVEKIHLSKKSFRRTKNFSATLKETAKSWKNSFYDLNFTHESNDISKLSPEVQYITIVHITIKENGRKISYLMLRKLWRKASKINCQEISKFSGIRENYVNDLMSFFYQFYAEFRRSVDNKNYIY